jgi:YHS domain-containing protein
MIKYFTFLFLIYFVSFGLFAQHKPETYLGFTPPKQEVAVFAPAEADEFYPSIARNGNLYFTAAYKNAKGKEDIYCAKWLNNAYQTPESLSDSVNQAGYEFNAFIAPDESYILFTGYGRADDMGGGDLYIATKNTQGEWTKARHLGNKINSKKIDYCPYVSADGKYLFFSSERHKNDFTKPQKNYQDWLQNMQSPQNGLSDIYWVEMSAIKAL